MLTLVLPEFILHMTNVHLACVFPRLEALGFKAAFGRALWLGLGQWLEARGLGWLDLLLLDGEQVLQNPLSPMQSEIQAPLIFT